MDLKELLGEAYKEGMTFEEVEAALKDITPPDTSTAEVTRLKAALSKANSEAAGYKKQLREKQECRFSRYAVRILWSFMSASARRE